MCGIAGIVDFKGNKINGLLLKAMCDAMIHRGPDDEGYYYSRNPGTTAALGHRRLSIIDLEGGHQPIHNEKKDIWVIHNGEIYNFMELKRALEKRGHVFYTRSDAEVIVHAYEEYGDDAVKYLRGMFAFAIWDEPNRKLILARDRIGKKPLLYSVTDNKLIFASEFKALLEHPAIDKEIDSQAIHHYLTYLCIPEPITIFKKVKKLPPAHILVWQDQDIKIKNYWKIDFSKKIKISEKEAIEQVSRIIEEAVKIRLVSDVPLGTLLSGGIDSSCVAAFMNKLGADQFHTFSIGFNEAQFNELPYARIVADYLKSDHSEYYVTPDALVALPELVERYGEPFGDSSALPTYYVTKAASSKVKVVLNGDGGDEVFAGYRRHLATYLAEKYGPLAKAINRSPFRPFFNIFPDKPSSPNSPGNIRRFLSAAELDRAHRHMRWIGFFDDAFKQRLYTRGFRHKTEGVDSSVFLCRLFDEAKGLDSIDAVLYADILFGLQTDLLVKMDIASMANSLETRAPLLDHQLMEFSASLPSDLKIRNFSLKYMLKKVIKGMVPDEILKRPKRGFAIPVDKWFRGHLKNYLIDTIFSKNALNRGYFEPDKLKEVVDHHLSGRNDYGQHLWGLLVLELWHRRFIDRTG
jgi:asparagine synthase (glutamine-hydrolysing)